MPRKLTVRVATNATSARAGLICQLPERIQWAWRKLAACRGTEAKENRLKEEVKRRVALKAEADAAAAEDDDEEED